MDNSLSQRKHGIEINRDFIIDAAAGVNGGIAHVYTGQPLDTIKVKMQAFPKQYGNMFTCFMETFRKEGIRRGLYAGTTPSLVAAAADNSVCFAYYGIMQKVVAYALDKPVSDLTPFNLAIAGAITGIGSGSCLCPIELIKCRMQATREMLELGLLKPEQAERGPLRVIAGVLNRDGIRGFFRGYVPTLCREIPGNFCFFGGYELTRWLLTPAGVHKDDIGVLRTGVAGGIGGIGLWVIGFPFDAAKSKIQIAQTSLRDTPRMSAVLLDAIRKDGFLSLYNGLLPTVIRAFPATAALFIAVEKTKKYLPMAFD